VTPLDLEPIKARVDAAMLDGSWDEPEARDREKLLAEVERLRTELARQAEQITAVRALADKWEHGALRWANPLPVPPEVALIREALDGPA
jgi:anti-sigma factor RsiW